MKIFIFFRSSYTARTIDSLQSFIYGLSPPETPNDEITFTTGVEQKEILEPDYFACQDFLQSFTKFQSTEEFQRLKNESAFFYKDLIDQSNLPWDDFNWLFVGDWILSLWCYGGDGFLPQYVDQVFFNKSLEYASYFALQGYTSQRGVAGASPTREIFRIFDEFISGESRVQFSLLSAHDITITSVLDTLGVLLDSMPPFASHLVFELYEKDFDYYIRTLYNGEELFGGLQKYGRLKSDVSDFISYCPEL